MITEDEIQIYINAAWKKKVNTIIDWLLIETLIKESFMLLKKSKITEHKALQLIDDILAAHTRRGNILPKID